MAGADPLSSNSTVASGARVELIVPTTGLLLRIARTSLGQAQSAHTSFLVESLAGRPCSLSSGPKTTVEQEASTCELLPSNHSR